jgi:hypothetical protein
MFMQYNQNYNRTYLNNFKSSQDFIHSSKPSSYLNVKYTFSPKKKQLEFGDVNLSLIQDPLWRRVCSEILHLMGPIAAQIFQVQLGVPQDKALDLYCTTEEMVEFLQTYNFVVLTTLQRYFPSLQRLNITSQAA